VVCELCGRDVPELTVHHLVPRERGGTGGGTAELCRACHRQVHALFDNRRIAAELGSLSALRSHPDLRRFVRWVRRQDPGRRIRVRRSREPGRGGRSSEPT